MKVHSPLGRSRPRIGFVVAEDFTDRDALERAIAELSEDTTVVCRRGRDALALEAAKAVGRKCWEVRVGKPGKVPEAWRAHDLARCLCADVDLVVAVPDLRARSLRHVIGEARRQGVPVEAL